MANKIKIKRGLAANRTSITPDSGELLFTTDEKKVYVGDGATAGGLPVAGAAANFQEFTASGTWTKPQGAQFVMVELWGGGGGGGSGARYTAPAQGGAGGGGGGYMSRLFSASELASSIPVVVGAGGTGGAAITTDSTSGQQGASGGATTFGTLMYVSGGGGGDAGSSGTSYRAGGVGGVGMYDNPPIYISASSLSYTMPGAFGRSAQAGNDTVAPPAGGYSGGSGGPVTSSGRSGAGSFFGGAGGGAGSSITAYGPGGAGSGGTRLYNSGNGGARGAYGQSGADGTVLSGGGGGGASMTSMPGINSRSGFAFGGNAYFVSSGYMLYVSTNGGSTYTFLRDLPFTSVNAIRVISGVAIACTSNGIYTSTDLTNWTNVYSGSSVIDIVYGSGKYLAIFSASSEAKISTDLINWSSITSVNATGCVRIVNHGSRFVIFTSISVINSNDGVTWTQNNKPSNMKYNFQYEYCSASTTRLISSNVSSSTDAFMMFYSDNWGASWNEFRLSYNNYNPMQFINGLWVFIGYNDYSFNGGDRHLYTSTDGTSWTSRGTISSLSLNPYLYDLVYTGTYFAGFTGFNTSNATIGFYSSSGTSFNSSTAPFQYTSGSKGGNGGIAAGGGGGSAAFNGYNSGAGGNGGNGLARVYAW